MHDDNITAHDRRLLQEARSIHYNYMDIYNLADKAQTPEARRQLLDLAEEALFLREEISAGLDWD